MTPIQEPQEVELPRGVVAEASAPLPVIQFPDGSTEPAPASSVRAEDIIGLITSEQIEELEAAKIGGKLTAEQIENVHAASIIGEIINSQIKGLGVGKLEGQITAAQIAANSIIAEKLAVGAVITEKIAAGAITTGKLAAEAITAEKISASAITTSKIAAGAITAEKITVIELSGITPHLGTITAGKIIGVEIEDTSMLLMKEATKEEFPESSAITWSGNEQIAGYEPEALKHVLWLQAWGTTGGANETKGEIRFKAFGKKLGIVETKQAYGELLLNPSELLLVLQGASKGSAGKTIIFNSAAESIFLQYGPIGEPAGNHRINFGVAVVKFSASTTSSTVTVTHHLGKTPTAVIATPQLGVMSSADTFSYEESTFKVVAFVGNAITLEATIPWIAIG